MVEIPIQRLLIAGAARPAIDGATYDKASPWTHQTVTTAPAAGTGDADLAVEAAADAYPDWSGRPADERGSVLLAAADILDDRAPDIAQTMTEEVGATHGWGMFNCMLAAGILRAAADLPSHIADEPIDSAVPGLAARAVRRPLGVVVAVAPWNAPVILGARAIAAPLALGNTVVFKASEECPRTHGHIAQALLDAGLPAGALNFLTTRPEDGPRVVERLIDHPTVRHINFTGSSHVGRLIAVRAAQQLKRTLLELGGKAPFLVFDDADVDEAAAAASFGAFMNAGQICMSTERVIAHRDIVERFTTRLANRAEALRIGDPTDPAVEVGPVVSTRAAQRVSDLIADAVEQGARIIAGGSVEGTLVQPTVIADVTPAMRIYSEESFGPVVTVTSFEDDDEALRLANDSAYGLSAAVFSADTERAEAIAARIDSGICHINGATVHDEPQMPFGGIRDSGWGRFGGTFAIDEFMDIRWMTTQNGGRAYPI